MALISAQFLEYWNSANSWKPAPVLTIQDSRNQNLYFQLIQLTGNGGSASGAGPCGGGSLFSTPPCPQRYLPGGPGAPATGSVTFSGLTGPGQNITLVLGGTTYTQLFSVDNNTTVAALATQLNSSPIAQKLVASVANSGTLTFTSSLGAAGNSIPFLASAVGGTVAPNTLTYLSGGAGWPGAALKVTFMNIDDAQVVTRWAFTPDPVDPSIWAVPLFQTDPIHGTVVVEFTLIEGASQTVFKVINALRVATQTSPCF